MSKVVSNSLAAATSTLTAKPIGYGVVQLSWSNITDTALPSLNKEVNNTYPSFTLVRKLSGYPQGITDGEVIRTVDNLPVKPSYTYFGDTGNYFVFDNGVTTAIENGTIPSENTKFQGNTVYYALFLTYPDTGSAPFRNKKISEASVVFVKNYGTLDFMLSHLPALYKKDSAGNFNNDLSDFLKLFAFAYDLYRTQAQDVFEAVSIDAADEKLIKLLLKQFGVSYDDVQDVTLARNVLKNVTYLSKSSGSYEGIYEFVKAYTGYNPTITSGYNLMFGYNSATFVEGVTHWYPAVEAATSPYGNAYLTTASHASALSLTGPTATGTSTIGAFSNKQGVSLTGASGTSGNTTITVDTTSGLIPGSIVEITSGTNYFPPGSAVVSVTSITTFTVSAAPTNNFTNAVIATSSNIANGMLSLTVANAGDNAFSLRPKIMKVDTLANLGATTLSVQPAIASVYDYVVGTNIQYGTYITAIDSVNSILTLSKPLMGSVPANTEIWAGPGFDKADLSTKFLPISAPNEPHTFSIYINRAGKTARNVRLDLRWRKVDGSISASNIVGTTTLTAASQTGATTWYRLVVHAVAPSDAAYCEPIITVVSAAIGDMYFFDAAQWQHGIKVYSAGISGNTATVTTVEPHGLTAGDNVSLALDGSYGSSATIGTVPSNTTFTFTVAASDDFQLITGAYGSSNIIYIPTGNISKVAIGSTITVSSGTGSFSSGTTVLAKLNDQAIFVSAVPSVALSNATIKLSQKVASQLLPSNTAKISGVRVYEDARVVYIDIAGTQVNEIANAAYWHSSSSPENLTNSSSYSTNTTVSGTVSIPFTGPSDFSPVFDLLQKPVQIIKATGFTDGTYNYITYTTDGVHDILVNSSPVVYNMKNFFVNDPIVAGRGNGFDLRTINVNYVKVSSVTDNTFTVKAAPLTLTSVSSGYDAAVGSYYIDTTATGYTNLWVGAKVKVVGGTGNLSTATDGVTQITTSITEYSSSVTGRFYIDYQPYLALSNATIEASLGIGSIGSSSFASSAPTALASYTFDYGLGRNVYYNGVSANYGALKGIPVSVGVPYVFAVKTTHSETGGGNPAYSDELNNYTYFDAMMVPYIEFTNGMSHNVKVPLTPFIKSVSRKNNIVTFTTTTAHNFKAGDLIYIKNVYIPDPLNPSNTIGFNNTSGSTTSMPYYITSVTSTTFSSRYIYRPTQASTPLYPMDGVDFANTTVITNNSATLTGYVYPPMAAYAVTNRINRYISGTASPFTSRTEVPWDPADGVFTYAIPGFYIVRTSSGIGYGTHTVNLTSSFFGIGNEFKYYFDGSIDPSNRIGGYLDTLWSGTPGDSSSHFYQNLASTSDRLRKVLPKAIPYGNGTITYPNTVLPLSAATVNAGGTEITFTSTIEHNLSLNSNISVIGFTGNTAVNVNSGTVKLIISPTKFVVSPPTTIATTAVTGSGVGYATNGWTNQYRIRYADKYYGAPYSLGYGFRYNIFVLNSTPLDDPIYTLK